MDTVLVGGFLAGILVAEIGIVVASRYALCSGYEQRAGRVARRWYGVVLGSMLAAFTFGGLLKWLNV